MVICARKADYMPAWYMGGALSNGNRGRVVRNSVRCVKRLVRGTVEGILRKVREEPVKSR